MPGVYYLKEGMDVGGRVIGGYEPGQPGVALMFDEAGRSTAAASSAGTMQWRSR